MTSTLTPCQSRARLALLGRSSLHAEGQHCDTDKSNVEVCLLRRTSSTSSALEPWTLTFAPTLHIPDPGHSCNPLAPPIFACLLDSSPHSIRDDALRRLGRPPLPLQPGH